MRRLGFTWLLALAALVGCHWQSGSSEDEQPVGSMQIDRFDRVESVYLTLADFGALRQMQTDYPVQLRTLIEDVLKLGPVNAPDINTRFLVFFQDSTLQSLIDDVAVEYADMTDVSQQLSAAFERLARMMPQVTPPRVYTQIGSLDQSIVVSDSLLGISLDKYLGKDHPVYARYGYTERQRHMMQRASIVPDCLVFYLLSRQPLPGGSDAAGSERHWHMVKIQYVVNQALGQHFFTDADVDRLEAYHRQQPGLSYTDVLRLDSLAAEE